MNYAAWIPLLPVSHRTGLTTALLFPLYRAVLSVRAGDSPQQAAPCLQTQAIPDTWPALCIPQGATRDLPCLDDSSQGSASHAGHMESFEFLLHHTVALAVILTAFTGFQEPRHRSSALGLGQWRTPGATRSPAGKLGPRRPLHSNLTELRWGSDPI